MATEKGPEKCRVKNNPFIQLGVGLEFWVGHDGKLKNIIRVRWYAGRIKQRRGARNSSEKWKGGVKKINREKKQPTRDGTYVQKVCSKDDKEEAAVVAPVRWAESKNFCRASVAVIYRKDLCARSRNNTGLKLEGVSVEAGFRVIGEEVKFRGE